MVIRTLSGCRKYLTKVAKKRRSATKKSHVQHVIENAFVDATFACVLFITFPSLRSETNERRFEVRPSRFPSPPTFNLHVNLPLNLFPVSLLSLCLPSQGAANTKSLISSTSYYSTSISNQIVLYCSRATQDSHYSIVRRRSLGWNIFRLKNG